MAARKTSQIDETRRAAILADIEAGGQSLRAIAEQHGVSKSTVSTYAKAAGIDGGFDRTKTAVATQARVVDLAARRAELKEQLLDDVARLRQRAWDRYGYYERGAEGPEYVELDLPPLREQRDAYAAINTAVGRYLDLEKADQGQGSTEVASFVGNLADALGAAYDALTRTDDGQAADAGP